MEKKETSTETVKVTPTVKHELFRIQGMLQLKDGRSYSIDEVIRLLIEKSPIIDFEVSPSLLKRGKC